jgi:hypothetical protein
VTEDISDRLLDGLDVASFLSPVSCHLLFVIAVIGCTVLVLVPALMDNVGKKRKEEEEMKGL